MRPAVMTPSGGAPLPSVSSVRCCTCRSPIVLWKASLKAREVLVDRKVGKVSVVGVGMRSHAGIASKTFKALADESINIQLITTSEIKISVVIEEKYLELAVRALHSAFELGDPDCNKSGDS